MGISIKNVGSLTAKDNVVAGDVEMKNVKCSCGAGPFNSIEEWDLHLNNTNVPDHVFPAVVDLTDAIVIPKDLRHDGAKGISLRGEGFVKDCKAYDTDTTPPERTPGDEPTS